MGAIRAVITAAIVAASVIPASGAGFDPRVVTFGSEREQIKSIPIEKRPNRPLHVYGNTVRRRSGRTAEAATKGNPRR